MRRIFISLFVISLLPTIALSENKTVSPTDIYHLPQQAITKKHLTPEDEKLYLTAYNIFLANKNLKDAFLIAEAMAYKEPDNIEWATRLANVAEWHQQPQIALQQWYKVAVKTKSTHATRESIRLAKLLNDDKKLKSLLHFKVKGSFAEDEGRVSELAQLELRLGNPEEAVKILRKQYEKEKEHIYLQKLAELHKQRGDAHAEMLVLEEMKKYPVVKSLAITREAEILFKQGNVQGAYDRLKHVQGYAKNDPQYWRVLASLAVLVHDKPVAMKALGHLYHHDKLAQDEYTQYLDFIGDTQRHHAFLVAQRAWKSHPRNLHFFVTVLDLGADLGEWQTLASHLEALPASAERSLDGFPDFWATKAKILQFTGQKIRARKSYLAAIKHFPDNDDLKVDYLWFLIDENYDGPLRHAMQRWYHQLPYKEKLREPYVQGFVNLGRLDLAIKLYEWEFPRKHLDPLWLTQFGDTQKTIEQHGFAHTLRNRAWHILTHRIHTRGSKMSDDDVRAFGELAMYLGTGDVMASTLREIFNRRHPDRNELLLVWALKYDNFDLARYTRDFIYTSSRRLPPWTLLTIALRDHDLPQMRYLMDHYAGRLPRRDRVAAEDYLGNPSEAEVWAYRALSEYPQDADALKQMIELMERNNNYAQVQQSDWQFGDIKGTRTSLAARVRLTPRLFMLPYSRNDFQYSRNNTLITNVPSKDSEVGALFHYLTQRGYIYGGFSHRDGLDSFYTGIVGVQKRISQRLSGDFYVGINQRSTDTSALQVGGAEDVVSASFDYEYTSYDLIYLQFQNKRIYDQSRNYLGKGFSVEGEASHKFKLYYPDYSLGIFGSYHSYDRDGLVVGRALTLIPPGDIANVNFFIPQDYHEVGLRFAFGEEWQTHYTHQWRPFLSVSVLDNSRTGTGYNYNLGIAGAVFGRDHLAFFCTHASNQTTENSTDSECTISYRRYFS